MTPVALLLSLSLSTSAPALVAISTEGFGEKDRMSVVDRVVADVEGIGVSPTLLPPGVVTPACVADRACAQRLFVGGTATRMVVVDVLRAGSRASVSARVVAADGTTLTEHSGVIPMTTLLGGHDPLLSDDVLAALSAPPPTPPPPPPTTTTTTTTQPSPPPPSPPPGTTTPPSTPTGAEEGPSVMAVAGVGVGAVGALFLIGGVAAALGQNAVRLDAGADGDARANTALTIPLALGVAALGAAGVGAGVYMLVGMGDEDPGVGG